MSDKYEMILKEEELFAKNVALQMRALRPQPFWHLLIPFKFVLEFFSAKRELNKFADNFLLPRKLALDAARRYVKGTDRELLLASVGNQLRSWLHEQQLFSQHVYDKLLAKTELLIDHYARLLQAQGGNYEALVRDAYQSKDNYATVLRQCSALESAIDEEVARRVDNETLRKNLATKQKIIAESRDRKLRRIFK